MVVKSLFPNKMSSNWVKLPGDAYIEQTQDLEYDSKPLTNSNFNSNFISEFPSISGFPSFASEDFNSILLHE